LSVNERVQIVFEIEQDDDSYPPTTRERLWAIPLGGSLYEVDNIPFFENAASCGDVVVAKERDGELVFDELQAPSGHSTFRVIVYDDSLVPMLRDELAALGCPSEASHIAGLFALDIPPHVGLAVVRSLLEPGEIADRWDVEEAIVANSA
jgi:hypothetical protein